MESLILIVFCAFGPDYVEQFEIARKTIPSRVQVGLITNAGRQIAGVKQVNMHRVHEIDALTMRCRLNNYFQLGHYDQVWYSDTDILFKGDIFAKYAAADRVILGQERGARADNIYMGGAFTEAEKAIYGDETGINAGLICVPRCAYPFFEIWNAKTKEVMKINPHLKFYEQHALNAMYFRNKENFALFDRNDIGFPTRATRGEYADHYIGYFEKKKDLMTRDYGYMCMPRVEPS